MKLLRLLTTSVLLLLISGCSTLQEWFGSEEDDATAPVELERIDAKVKLKKQWSTKVGDGQGDGLNRVGRVRERRRSPVAQRQRGLQRAGRRERADVLGERGRHFGRALAKGPVGVVRVCLPGGRSGARRRADTRRADVVRHCIRPLLRANEGEEGRYD